MSDMTDSLLFPVGISPEPKIGFHSLLRTGTSLFPEDVLDVIVHNDLDLLASLVIKATGQERIDAWNIFEVRFLLL